MNLSYYYAILYEEELIHQGIILLKGELLLVSRMEDS